MNMISQIRLKVKRCGDAVITAEEFNQLQAEWIKRSFPWISVDERLPNDNQIIISSDGDGMEFTVYRSGIWFAMFTPILSSPCQSKDDNVIEGTTHWMPIPELPEAV